MRIIRLKRNYGRKFKNHHQRRRNRGTHFPAVSIANAIKEQHPEAEILFVGAEGRMEMQRVPAAGYPIKGLPVAGFDRKNLLKNISVF